MLTREEAKKLAGQVLSYSKFPECTVSITSSEQAFTRFANNGITTAALVNRHSVSIASTRDGRSGRTVVNDLDDAALARALAPEITPDVVAAIAERERVTDHDVFLAHSFFQSLRDTFGEGRIVDGGGDIVFADFD